MRRNYILLLLWASLATAIAAPRLLIDTDFGTAAQKATSGASENQRVTGVLPPGWRDNSEWAQVWVQYERLEEEGRAFVRAKVTRLEDGRCQLMHPLPKIEGETFYRLSFTARSAAGTSIQIGFRDAGAPYNFPWETKPKLTASWRDYHYDFRLNKYDREIGLWILLEGMGELDLARLQLEQLTRADYIAELKSRHADSPPNLLRISRFPLGLQSGWSLRRENSDGDDVVIVSDRTVTGPSRAPALRVQTKEPTALTSAPFGVPIPFETHTASLYVQGHGQITLAVLSDGRTIKQQTFTLKDGADWQRLELAFEPVLMARAYCVRIESSTTFWLDALQVERGAKASPYTAQRSCEVALAVPPSEASAALVQFHDEPPVVRYSVSGNANGALLKAKVLNAYGEEKELPPVTLGQDFLSEGSLRFDRFPDKPSGPFRVEAWVEDQRGKRISSFNELVIYRLPRPRYWGKDAPDSPFGVHTLSTTRHNTMVKAIGANWTRLHDAGLEYIGWYHLERKPGEWTFHDKEIHRYRRHHIKVLGELGTAPEWASYFPGQAHSRYFDRFYQPKRLEDYAHYVRVVTGRYRGVIDAYDVWNEPWIAAWWGVAYDESKSDRAGYITSKEPQADFARLMRTAYETAKKVDPNITILGVNSTTGSGGSGSLGGAEWTRGVVAAGGLDHCDAIAYHAYISGKPGYPGDVVEKGFQVATGPILERLGKLPKPVWMTEGSAARDTIGPGFYHHTLPFPNPEDPIETADRLCRYVVSLLAQGVQKVFLYSMHAHSVIGAPSSWRVIVTDEGMLHPSGAAHGVMAWHLEDTRFVKAMPVADGVAAYLFEGKSRAVAVISGAPGHAPYTPPAHKELEVADLFGNPVPARQPLGESLIYISAPTSAEELARRLNGDGAR